MAKHYTQFDEGLTALQRTSGAGGYGLDTTIFETGTQSVFLDNDGDGSVAQAVFWNEPPFLAEADLPISIFFAGRITNTLFTNWLLGFSLRNSEAGATRFAGGIRPANNGAVGFAQVGTSGSVNGPLFSSNVSGSDEGAEVWIHVVAEILSLTRVRLKAWIPSRQAEPSTFGADYTGASQSGFSVKPRLTFQSGNQKKVWFDRIGIGTQGDAAPRSFADMSRIFVGHGGQAKRLKQAFVLQGGVVVPVKKAWIGTANGNKPLIG